MDHVYTSNPTNQSKRNPHQGGELISDLATMTKRATPLACRLLAELFLILQGFDVFILIIPCNPNKLNPGHFFLFTENRPKQYSATMSAILSADDLNDFISPGVACIKPVETLPPKDTKNQEVCPLNGLIGTMWHLRFFC